MRWFRSGASRGFLAGFLVASVMFGGVAMAQEIIQRDIHVSYLPLKFMFDGVEKAPPADQQGFTFNERTFVPLRFMSEALGKKVEWDQSTYTIYVGRRPGALPNIWKTYKTEGDANVKLDYFTGGALTVAGQEMPESLLVTAIANAPAKTDDPAFMDRTTVVSTEIVLDGRYKTMSGTLFIPDSYYGHVGDRLVGQMTVLSDTNKILYKSSQMTQRFDPLPFSFSVENMQKVRVMIAVNHPYGLPIGSGMVSSQFGLSNLKWE
ncbi:MAG TPA: copper amine oxidase N-terminal domain-containing protein [Symbiobacteriaceae bacterium]|jgi:hypothetical protein|nr:copper amine oxidase N-terminal domain-containing protein [Symbiobacteriaceae bacterium]